MTYLAFCVISVCVIFECLVTTTLIMVEAEVLYNLEVDRTEALISIWSCSFLKV